MPSDTASKLAPVLSELSYSCARTLADEMRGRTKTKRFIRKLAGRWGTPELHFEAVVQVAAEFLYVFLHVADRLAFGTLDEQKRNQFIDTLIDTTICYFVKSLLAITERATEISGHNLDDFDLKEQELERGIHKEFYERHLEYSKCEGLFAEPEESLGNTVFWEFGAYVSKTIGHEEDIWWVSEAFMLAVSTLKTINIQDALDEIAS